MSIALLQIAIAVKVRAEKPTATTRKVNRTYLGSMKYTTTVQITAQIRPLIIDSAILIYSPPIDDI